MVTPSSLCQNWAEEAKKWLGLERLPTLVLGPGPDGAATVNDFRHGAVHRLLITSYETVRKHAAALAGAVDLLVCDEVRGRVQAGGQAAGWRLAGLVAHWAFNLDEQTDSLQPWPSPARHPRATGSRRRRATRPSRPCSRSAARAACCSRGRRCKII